MASSFVWNARKSDVVGSGGGTMQAMIPRVTALPVRVCSSQNGEEGKLVDRRYEPFELVEPVQEHVKLGVRHLTRLNDRKTPVRRNVVVSAIG